jgi:hypothetical protein
MTCPRLFEPITVSQWWRNWRAEAARVRLSTWEGYTLIDIRTWRSTEDKLVPSKGFAADIKHLPRLTAALAKAEAKAREWHLITDDDRCDQ